MQLLGIFPLQNYELTKKKQRKKMMIKKYIILVLALVCVHLSMLQAQIIDKQGQYVDTLFHDHINRQAEDFVKLSLLISEPSQGLFTAMGHTAFHLECPTFGLDYVYHYAQVQEDSLSSLTRSYLLGKFVVAMVVDSFSTYMNYSNIDKRGIYEYALHITPQEKQKL